MLHFLHVFVAMFISMPKKSKQKFTDILRFTKKKCIGITRKSKPCKNMVSKRPTCSKCKGIKQKPSQDKSSFLKEKTDTLHIAGIATGIDLEKTVLEVVEMLDQITGVISDNIPKRLTLAVKFSPIP